MELDWDEVERQIGYSPDDDEKPEIKWEFLRKPVLSQCDYKEVEYTVPTERRLAQRFKDSGLQIIVKMASIELTPEKPEFPAGGWHVSFKHGTIMSED